MATTTNFGWETPDDTDLVKDGAAAMRTLGNAIDASMVDLKGGTTGQILTKASATDMDFSWTSPNPGDITAVNVTSPITGGGTSGDVTISIQDATTAQKGAVQLENSTSSTSTTTAAVPASVKSAYDLANAAIPKSLVDAAGDLIYGSANDTVARLGIGSNGQYLTVSSGLPAWATLSAGGMTLLASGTLSGSSVVVSSLSTSYNDLRIIIRNFRPATDNNRIYFRLNNDATANRHKGVSSFSVVAGDAFNETSIQINEGVDNGTANLGLISYTIHDYANTVSAKMVTGFSISNNYTTNTSVNFYANNGIYNQTSAITGITFLTLTGNFTSGDYYIYGVK